MRWLVKGGAGEFVAAAADFALDVGLAGLVARWRQPQKRPRRLAGAEPLRPVDRGAEGERRDWPDDTVVTNRESISHATQGYSIAA